MSNFTLFSVKSFCELGLLLLRMDGVNSFLSEYFLQDPLKECFQKQRARLGAHENPCYEETGHNSLALDVAGWSLVKTCRGNSRGAQLDGPTFNVEDRKL